MKFVSLNELLMVSGDSPLNKGKQIFQLIEKLTYECACAAFGTVDMHLVK